ncbi:histidine kinase [Pedobacter sp. PAMC26386]|nr:histidine kinase [Pedobacter sp. PAMC26386]
MIYRVIYFVGYSTGYYFLVRTRQRRELVEKMELQEINNLIQEKEIKNELVLTQNAFLRSQINPDFLIKTLDYLYKETLKSEPIAAESILSLSQIMQYALSKEASTGFVTLEKEIILIENFLLLHQVRQVNQAQLNFSYTKECLSMEFIPLVLMTLTENILKHGLLDDPDKPAEIKITCENSVLHIETSNRQATNSKIPSYGIGLKNIKERLVLAYGETTTFDYHLDSKGDFHTSIQVQI